MAKEKWNPVGRGVGSPGQSLSIASQGFKNLGAAARDTLDRIDKQEAAKAKQGALDAELARQAEQQRYTRGRQAKADARAVRAEKRITDKLAADKQTAALRDKAASPASYANTGADAFAEYARKQVEANKPITAEEKAGGAEGGRTYLERIGLGKYNTKFDNTRGTVTGSSEVGDVIMDTEGKVVNKKKALARLKDNLDKLSDATNEDRKFKKDILDNFEKTYPDTKPNKHIDYVAKKVLDTNLKGYGSTGASKKSSKKKAPFSTMVATNANSEDLRTFTNLDDFTDNKWFKENYNKANGYDKDDFKAAIVLANEDNLFADASVSDVKTMLTKIMKDKEKLNTQYTSSKKKGLTDAEAKEAFTQYLNTVRQNTGGTPASLRQSEDEFNKDLLARLGLGGVKGTAKDGTKQETGADGQQRGTKAPTGGTLTKDDIAKFVQENTTIPGIESAYNPITQERVEPSIKLLPKEDQDKYNSTFNLLTKLKLENDAKIIAAQKNRVLERDKQNTIELAKQREAKAFKAGTSAEQKLIVEDAGMLKEYEKADTAEDKLAVIKRAVKKAAYMPGTSYYKDKYSGMDFY